MVGGGDNTGSSRLSALVVALHFAARNGYPDIVAVLLACPIVNAKAADNNRLTALDLCEQFRQNDWEEAARLLRDPQVCPRARARASE